MDSLSLTFACGFQGTPTGTDESPDATVEGGIRHVASVEFSGSGKQCHDRTSDKGTPYTIAAGATLTLDLKTGLRNPLGEPIGGGDAFAKVYGVMVHHKSNSSSSGITVLGGTLQPFQGPFSSGDKATLAPKYGIGFWCEASGSGWTVTAASNQQIDIVNLDASNAATVSVFILGTTS